MALSAADFMKGEPADHLDADAFLKGEEIPQSKKEPASIFEEDALGNKREWGLDPAAREAAYGHGVLPDMAVSAADLGSRALTGLQVGTEAVAGGLDKAWQSMTPEGPTGDLTRSVHPGQALMAWLEGTPEGNLSHGMGLPIGGHVSPETEKGIQSLFTHGTTDEIVSAVRQAGSDIDPKAVADFVQKRDAGATIDPRVRYDENGQAGLPLEEQGNLPYERPTQGEAGLKNEADRFMAGKPAEPNLDYRQRDLPLEQPAQQLGLDLPEPTVKDIHPDIPQETPKGVQSVIDHVNETAADWKNAPKVEVHSDFSKLDNVDPNALGAYDADSGQIRLNTRAIEEEAAYRGLDVKQMTNTVLFHEGLGHFGLDQHFRTGLDSTLTTFYKESPAFKRQVNQWMKDNPDAYHEDLNPTARAAEEVLAEASEGGAIPLTLNNRLKNFVKASARKMGIKLDYSDREIKTILAQAHEKVLKGGPVSTEGEGLRYQKPSSKDEFKADEDASSIAKQYGITNIDEAMKDPQFRYAVLQARRRRMGLEHDNVRVETPQDDIDWVEKTRRLNQDDLGTEDSLSYENGRSPDPITTYTTDEVNRLLSHKEAGSRYMMRRAGSGSKGTLKGHINDEEASPSVLASYRSNRNISDIIKENAAEKTKESWDEWIDKAGNTKMTGKMAEGLSTGTETHELIAAKEFLLKSSNRIYDLSKKAANGTLAPRETYLLGQEIQRNKNISEAIYKVLANSARNLNAQKIEVATDKALNDSIRRMMSRTTDEMLNDPDAIQQLAETLVEGHDKAQKMASLMQEVSNAVHLPRTLMSSMDLSAPFRQGLFMIGRKQFWNSFNTMFKAFGHESAFDAAQESIKNNPTYPLMKEHGLALAELGTDLTKREENFMSNWGNKVPLVKRSERAYTAFLNKVRADTFSDLVTKAESINPDGLSPKALDDLAGFINNATGRGDLGSWNQAATKLNGIFFSPRLIASRVNLLNPVYYYKLDPFVRKEAVKSLITLGGIALTVTSLAKMAGASVEADPRSSDFAKIKAGNTRYDILGGFGQYLTLGARLAMNSTKTSRGDVKELGKGYKADTRKTIVEKFGENKFAPVPGYVRDYLDGKNPVGEPFDPKSSTAKLFVPLFLQDAKDVIKEQGAVRGAAMSIPGLFGVGMQTYDANKKKAPAPTRLIPSDINADDFMKGQAVQ